MGDFLIRSITEGALGVCLIPLVGELVDNTNTTYGKFPLSPLKARKKFLGGFDTWRPINLGTRRDVDVMVSFPVSMDSRHEKGVITVLLQERRLFETR